MSDASVTTSAMATVVPLHPVQPPKRQHRKAGLKPGWNPWPGVRGGRVYLGKDEVISYYVERMIGGQRRGPVNLRASDPDTALARLKTWEQAGSPGSWTPSAPTGGGGGVLLTEELIAAYVAWCREVPPGKVRQRNTDKEWVAKKRNYLSWWMEQLDGRSLRSDGSPGCVTTDDLAAILKTAPGYRQRLEAIKALYGFLRFDAGPELRVAQHQDPSDPIAMPRPDAAQLKPAGSKVAWSKEDSDKVIEWLLAYEVKRRRSSGKMVFSSEEAAEYLGLSVATVRAFAERGRIRHEGGGQGTPLVFHRRALDEYDARRGTTNVTRRVALALTILGGTAWHVTEVVRWSQHGQIDALPADHTRQHGAAKVLVCIHKTGVVFPTAVSKKVAEAAVELRQLGGISRDPIFKWTKKAVEATGVASFKPGRFRHRQATAQMNAGADMKKVSEGLGHTNTATTLIYTALAVKPKQQTWY